MRQPGFPQIVYQQAGNGGGVASLAQRANRIIRGSQNMDLPVEQFLLNVRTDLGDHVYQKLMGYAATVHMLGLLAGVIGTPAEQKKVRDQLTAAIDAYLKTIKVDNADEGVYFETAGGGMDGGGGMALAWLLSKWFGMEGTQKQIERAGRVNHQVNQAMSQMVTDFIASLWNDFKKTWEEFWKNLDEKGLLFAVHKLQIDATFLAAEIGITIAISVVTEGAAALALGALRIVGERIGATVTRVVVRGVARAAEKTAMKSGILFSEEIADSQIDKKIIKEVFDEDKLGVGSKRSDVARRAEEQARPVEKPSGSGDAKKDISDPNGKREKAAESPKKGKQGEKYYNETNGGRSLQNARENGIDNVKELDDGTIVFSEVKTSDKGVIPLDGAENLGGKNFVRSRLQDMVEGKGGYGADAQSYARNLLRKMDAGAPVRYEKVNLKRNPDGTIEKLGTEPWEQKWTNEQFIKWRDARARRRAKPKTKTTPNTQTGPPVGKP